MMDFWIFLNYLKRFWSFLIFRFWFAVKSTKMKNKKTLDHVAKLELERWFESRKLHPYASNTDIQVLALKTKVEENKIKKWIENKRTRSKLKASANDTSITYLSKNDKIILRNFYNSKTKHPGPEDLIILENVIQKEKTKIRSWFNNQRFRDKDK
jgi:RNase adaptor protein for sRNA GlmZ degradation